MQYYITTEWFFPIMESVENYTYKSSEGISVIPVQTGIQSCSYKDN